MLSLSKAAAIYAGLTTTPFVSLYGSLNWAEDFAEYATWSHFTTELQQPYRIVLSRKGAPDTVVEPTGTEQVQKRVKPLAQQ